MKVFEFFYNLNFQNYNSLMKMARLKDEFHKDAVNSILIIMLNYSYDPSFEILIFISFFNFTTDLLFRLNMESYYSFYY
jgi:hypothetical protein